MGGFGFDELLLIMLISILAFGKDLPRVARKAGMFVRRARRYLLDIKEDIERQIPMEELDLQEDIHLDNSQTRSGAQPPRPYIPEEDLLENDCEEEKEEAAPEKPAESPASPEKDPSAPN